MTILTFAMNIWRHFWVPTACFVSKMDTSFKQLFDININGWFRSHDITPFFLATASHEPQKAQGVTHGGCVVKIITLLLYYFLRVVSSGRLFPAPTASEICAYPSFFNSRTSPAFISSTKLGPFRISPVTSST